MPWSSIPRVSMLIHGLTTCIPISSILVSWDLNATSKVICIYICDSIKIPGSSVFVPGILALVYGRSALISVPLSLSHVPGIRKPVHGTYVLAQPLWAMGLTHNKYGSVNPEFPSYIYTFVHVGLD